MFEACTGKWFGFHFDRASLTMNIALSSDDEHGGGALLAIVDQRLRRCERQEGTATVHASTLLHAVTRMVHGERYALILFYRQVCPHAVRSPPPGLTHRRERPAAGFRGGRRRDARETIASSPPPIARVACARAQEHALALVSAETMAALYPAHDGGYHCDRCGDDAETLGWPGMWHCAEGCEYDLCRDCYDQRVGACEAAA